MSSIFDLDAEYNRSRVIKDLDTRDVEIDKLKQQLATLREAGEKMRTALEDIKLGNDLYGADIEAANAALEAWEAA